MNGRFHVRSLRVGTGCAALLLLFAVSAHGQQNTYARGLAATCFTCHGTDGHSVGGVPPSIAGRNKTYLLQQLNQFRSDARPATIMHQQAKGYTPEQLELIAGYFANVAPARSTPAPAARVELKELP